jgi:hypothetical protein
MRLLLTDPRLGYESENAKLAEGLAQVGAFAVGFSALTAAGWAVGARRP